MEPAGVAVEYRLASGEGCVFERDVFAAGGNEDLSVTVSFDGEIGEVAVVPSASLEVVDVRVALRHAFGSDERVLLGGYQSWTDTVERPAWSRMRGLRGVPSAVVGRYALDGMGDYAIWDYPARRGRQHGFTYGTFRRGEGMALVGSLDEKRGFTLIETQAARGRVVLRPEPPARMLQVGERAVLARFAIVRGTTDECYDRWFELSGVKARPAKPLVGYTSWYRHYGDITEEKLLADLDGAARFFSTEQAVTEAVAAGKAAKLFQIDDGYCKVGDWLEVDERDFPNGLAPLAARIREAGFLPGLWLAPFVCERGSRLFSERDDWLLRDEEGKLVRTGSHWSGGYALDTRNVEVRSYILEVLQAMAREWGFALFKVDFLYAACMVCHDGMNRGQLMADAMELLRKGAGEDALILACGVPMASAFGMVDYCRIGCDVGLDWDDAPHMRLLHRERVSTKNSLANTYGRAPLDGRAFANDPDVFFLRDDVRLSEAQRNELLFADADLGSMLLSSDDMGAWDERQRDRFRQAFTLLAGKGFSA